MPRLKAEVQNYLIACEIESHSDRTIEEKRSDLGKLIWFFEAKGHTVCDHPTLQAFFLYLRNGHKERSGRWGNARETESLSSGRMKKYYSQIRAFLNWMVKEYDLAVSPIAKISPPIDRPDQVQPFTQEHLTRLLAAARRTAHPKRDVAILSLMLETELLHLNSQGETQSLRERVAELERLNARLIEAKTVPAVAV
ncbi:MAG: hypothetical protein SFU56_20745 [Capsulimonadales bacterium]|nr:hypothetical protein [Capsulimonadales bacterium]